MANLKAYAAVAQAVKTGDLPKVKSQVCVDCGNQAKHYDHRDYDKPLDVDPVCVSCNLKRGKAKGPHDLNIRLTKEVKDALTEKAKADDRSTTNLIQKILKEAVSDEMQLLSNNN